MWDFYNKSWSRMWDGTIPPEGSHCHVTENVNLRVELSHLTLLTITDFFSHIICQIILYLCPTWQWMPLKKIIIFDLIDPAVSEEIIFKWFFAEFSIFSNGGHLGWQPGSSDTILKDDHLKTIPPQFGPNWPSSFRGDNF
jgi:hypothetical protein